MDIWEGREGGGGGCVPLRLTFLGEEGFKITNLPKSDALLIKSTFLDM